MAENRFDVVVLGGGAAGLMCAFTAANRGRSVVVLERSNKVGKKILMSGGGRCNFTNMHCQPKHFISHNPHFCKSALSRYTQWDFIALVDRHDIPYHEKKAGQLFCDRSSKDIVTLLMNECDRAGVTVVTHCADCVVDEVHPYRVRCAQGEYVGESLVVATGGLSIPKMGGSEFGYRFAEQLGLAVRDTRAGLVPFTFTGETQHLNEQLSGVSLPATVSCGNQAFTEDMLFTHRGMSGPAMLQLSSYWHPGDAIQVDVLAGQDAYELLLEAKQQHPRSLLKTVLAQHLPRACVSELIGLFSPDWENTSLAEIPHRALRALGENLNTWVLKPAATEGYRTAEVTLGGVDTSALSSKTMACKDHPGLYFIGEVVDVTGHLGGFNFQWAWSSAVAAGRAL